MDYGIVRIEEVLDPSLALQTHDSRNEDRMGKGKRHNGVFPWTYHIAFAWLVGTVVEVGAHQLQWY